MWKERKGGLENKWYGVVGRDVKKPKVSEGDVENRNKWKMGT